MAGIMEVDDNATLCNVGNRQLLLAVSILTSATAVVSFLMCFVAIAILLKYMCSKSTAEYWNTFSHRLIVSFLLSAFFYSLFTCFQWVRITHESSRLHTVRGCEAVAFFVEYFSWTLVLTTCLLFFHLFRILCLENSERLLRSWCKTSDHIQLAIYMVISFFVPLLFTWVPFIPAIKGYGPSGYWCWLMICDKDGNRYITGYVEQAFLWYGSILLVMVVIAALIVPIICQLCKKRPSNFKIACPLMMFPLIFFLINVVGVVNRVITLILNQPIPFLSFVHGFIDSLWGAVAAVVIISYICVVECKNCTITRRAQHDGGGLTDTNLTNSVTSSGPFQLEFDYFKLENEADDSTL